MEALSERSSDDATRCPLDNDEKGSCSQRFAESMSPFLFHRVVGSEVTTLCHTQCMCCS